MYKTFDQQLKQELAYLNYMRARLEKNPTDANVIRMATQQEVVDILLNTIDKINNSLVVNGD